jgi:hypothetical protein
MLQRQGGVQGYGLPDAATCLPAKIEKQVSGLRHDVAVSAAQTGGRFQPNRWLWKWSV